MPIQETDTKLASFTDAMMSEATEESQNVISDLSKRETEMMEKARKEIAAETEQYKEKKLSEIHAREGFRVNSRMTENKRALLQYREDCANETYEAVRAKIAEFTASEEYFPHLVSLLKKAVDVFGYGFSAEVELRAEDMHFANELSKSVSGVSLAFSEGSFELGGLRLYCPAKSKQVDLTFDDSLEDIMGHFAEITGLRVDE